MPGNGAEIHSGDTTRPLSVLNMDHRILGGAYRIASEPLYVAIISPSQGGFLRGRSMLANILDMEHAASTAPLTHSRPAMVFYDFRAALNGINHDFPWATLARAGTDVRFLNAFKAFYRGNHQRVLLRGKTSTSFPVTYGIRQGCPLSPLLFAMVIDPFLRRLASIHNCIILRAFADDIGLALRI